MDLPQWKFRWCGNPHRFENHEACSPSAIWIECLWASTIGQPNRASLDLEPVVPPNLALGHMPIKPLVASSLLRCRELLLKIFSRFLHLSHPLFLETLYPSYINISICSEWMKVFIIFSKLIWLQFFDIGKHFGAVQPNVFRNCSEPPFNTNLNLE